MHLDDDAILRRVSVNKQNVAKGSETLRESTVIRMTS
jgi:hypothetical protein